MRARLVERLGLSAATVSETVGRLAEQGYAELAGDRSLHLTDKGRGLATTVVRRHRLVELLGDTATCPHGNPIPGSHHAGGGPPTRPLSAAEVGPVTVRRVSERLE